MYKEEVVTRGRRKEPKIDLKYIRWQDLYFRVKLAGPKQFSTWTRDRLVTKTDTINYKTGDRPLGGLCCVLCFGTDHCLCSNGYRGERYKGLICPKCGVEITGLNACRSRMGLIKLCVPVVHPWFDRPNNNKIATILEITSKDFTLVKNFEMYLVINPGNTDLELHSIITPQDYEKYKNYTDFIAVQGPEGIKEALAHININQKIKKLKALFDSTTSVILRKKYRNMIFLLKGFETAGISLTNLVLDSICVLPIDLRPIVALEGHDYNRLGSSLINTSYKLVIVRNKTAQELSANRIMIPVIVTTARRSLQESITNLFCSQQQTTQVEGAQQTTSLEDMMCGKEGRLREGSNGKRTDFSGRAVIVGVSRLKMDECMVPRDMALEIYKFAIIGYLRKAGLTSSFKETMKLLKTRNHIVYTALNDIIKNDFPLCILNRAPTLHKNGWQAFKIKLWNQPAIGIPYTVCGGFNADFDGDQMAYHSLLTKHAQAEGLELMLSRKNIVSKANIGGLVISYTKDIAFGVYVLTKTSSIKKEYYFANQTEMHMYLMKKEINIDTEIDILVEEVINNETIYNMYTTTPGRIIFWNALPKHPKINFSQYNTNITTKILQGLFESIIRYLDEDTLSHCVDKIKDLGVEYAYLLGGSIGLDDLFDVDLSNIKIEEQRNKEAHILYNDGFIGYEELNKIHQSSIHVIESGKDILRRVLLNNKKNTTMASIMHSGARGSVDQLGQVLYMKGIVNTENLNCPPIFSNHKQGFSPLDYFKMGAAARKSCEQVASKTPLSGQNCRNLAFCAADCIIEGINCDTKKYIILTNMFINGALHSVYKQALGRVTAVDIISPQTNKLLVPKYVLINEDVIDLLIRHDVLEIPVRSVLFCRNKKTVCATCYGGYPHFAPQGEAVGVIAAQSIAEPGTQLTMQSYHSGGVQKFGLFDTKIVAPFDNCIIEFSNNTSLVNLNEKSVIMSKNASLIIRNKYGQLYSETTIPMGAYVYVKHGDIVSKETLLVHYGLERYIVSEYDGRVQLIYPAHTKQLIINIEDSNGKTLTHYILIDLFTVHVKNGDYVKRGTMLATTQQLFKNINIVTGLIALVGIFENREISNQAILAPCDGIAKIVKTKRGSDSLVITASDGEKHKYDIEIENLLVVDGQTVKRGEYLVNGIATLADIANKRSIDELRREFLIRTQSIYHQNNLTVHDRHFEVILRQMCCNVEIDDTYHQYDFLKGDIVALSYILDLNDKIEASGGEIIKYNQQILGITNAAFKVSNPLRNMSFQKTASVIADAAIESKFYNIDDVSTSSLVGVPTKCGTGYVFRNLHAEAADLIDYKLKELQAEFN